MIAGAPDKLDLVADTRREAQGRRQGRRGALLAVTGLAIGMLCTPVLIKPAPPTIRIIDSGGAGWIRSPKYISFLARSLGQTAAERERGPLYEETPACKKPDALPPRLLVRHAGDPAHDAAGELPIRHSIAVAAGAALGQASFPQPEHSNMNSLSATELVEAVSSEPFAPTVERLTAAIQQAGLMVFARIDHAAAASESGLQMPPTIVLVYGHAKGGTPIMLAAPSAALELPLRVLVREGSGGQVVVSFKPVGPSLQAMGVPAELLERLEPAQRLILDAMHKKARGPTESETPVKPLPATLR